MLRTREGAATAYIGGLYEADLRTGTERLHYAFAGDIVAQREVTGGWGPLVYLHGDHLGSVAVATSDSGAVVSRQDFTPWGEVRSGGIGETTRNFTGQKRDGTGLLFYNARYYDPGLGRFLSADSIVPGTAAGSGGGGATLGYDEAVALTPLTVDFHEPGFAAGVGAENAFTLDNGFGFQLDDTARREAKYQGGPANPQALNRYSYTLNNPVRYVDPTGHCVEVVSCSVQGVAAGAGVCGPACAAVGGLIGAGVGLYIGNQLYHAIADKNGSPKGRPLTSDESKLIDRIDSVPDWIEDHPDLADEARTVNRGGTLPPGRNHVSEAEQQIGMLDKAIRHLNGVRRSRSPEAQRAIDAAISRAERYKQRLRRILTSQ